MLRVVEVLSNLRRCFGIRDRVIALGQAIEKLTRNALNLLISGLRFQYSIPTYICNPLRV